ncbi:hypothetical protein U1Q18_048346 [Sarracenia purpurea var. burkii]
MGLVPDAAQVGTWSVDKSKARRKNDDDDSDEEKGCWFKFRFFGRCMPSGSKVDSSISGTSTQDGILLNNFTPKNLRSRSPLLHNRQEFVVMMFFLFGVSSNDSFISCIPCFVH